MFRLANDYYGGKYILITFIRVLFGSIILVSIPYSLDLFDSICSGLRTYVARPPLVPPCLLDSISVNPSMSGASAPSAIHVSWMQNMSMCSLSNIDRIFR